jgi:hypothetical protein
MRSRRGRMSSRTGRMRSRRGRMRRKETSLLVLFQANQL